MDPLVHTRDQGTVETVDFTWRTCSEEGVFWDSQRVVYIDYLEKGQNGYTAVLCRIIGPIRRRVAENTAPFGKE